jgi:hypothetical protein
MRNTVNAILAYVKGRLVTFLVITSISILLLVLRRNGAKINGKPQYNYTLSTPLNSSWVMEFKSHERKIFANIATVNRPPRYVEFGVENGQQCNTRFLREQLGWRGLMMDGGNENPNISLHREIITSRNINDLLAKYDTPSIIDLLSIDVE